MLESTDQEPGDEEYYGLNFSVPDRQRKALSKFFAAHPEAEVIGRGYRPRYAAVWPPIMVRFRAVDGTWTTTEIA